MKKYIISFIITALSSYLMAQEVLEKSDTRKQRLEKAIYGNLLNPSVSSLLMPKGFVEVNIFNSLLTSKFGFDSEKKQYDFNYRATYYYGLAQITYGVTPKLNVGIDLTYTAGRSDADPQSSPLKVFSSDKTNLYQQEKALTNVGVRARFLPTHNKAFVVQSSIIFPIASKNVQTFTGQSRISFNNQFLYNVKLGYKWYIFGQLGVNYLLKKSETDYGQLSIPAFVYCSYLLGNKLLPFVLIGHTSVFAKTDTKNFDRFAHYSQYGAGLQYQFSLRFSLNAYYSNVIDGKNFGGWQNYNFGTRIVI